MSHEQEVHVIFGRRALGLAVARHLLAKGKRVRIVNRHGKAQIQGEVEIVAADATDAEQTRKACQGADVVYQCAAPPIPTGQSFSRPSREESLLVQQQHRPDSSCRRTCTCMVQWQAP